MPLHGRSTRRAVSTRSAATAEDLVSITTRSNARSQAVIRRLGMQRAPELDL